MGKFIDLTGKHFGYLTVLKKCEYSKTSHTYLWECQCVCGNITKINGNNLKSGHTISCGCKKGKTTHGKHDTRLYCIYYNMKQRCYNSKTKWFKNYGGRGITICQEWLDDFMNFYNWAIDNGYKDNLTIDRIDVNGNYCPENCRWVDKITQANNTRNNRYETYNGETHTIAEWAIILGINSSTLRNRLTRHSFIEAINM